MALHAGRGGRRRGRPPAHPDAQLLSCAPASSRVRLLRALCTRLATDPRVCGGVCGRCVWRVRDQCPRTRASSPGCSRATPSWRSCSSTSTNRPRRRRTARYSPARSLGPFGVGLTGGAGWTRAGVRVRGVEADAAAAELGPPLPVQPHQQAPHRPAEEGTPPTPYPHRTGVLSDRRASSSPSPSSL